MSQRTHSGSRRDDRAIHATQNKLLEADVVRHDSHMHRDPRAQPAICVDGLSAIIPVRQKAMDEQSSNRDRPDITCEKHATCLRHSECPRHQVAASEHASLSILHERELSQPRQLVNIVARELDLSNQHQCPTR